MAFEDWKLSERNSVNKVVLIENGCSSRFLCEIKHKFRVILTWEYTELTMSLYVLGLLFA
jgi:hypothetical protein